MALLLANVVFWQPLWAQAEGIVVSSGSTRVDQAANGVPIINIAAPNGSGLSHNHFKDYNVGSQGLILNNATQSVQSTQLAGQIIGNANLNGTAARIILNEVNGGSPSQLRGYTEVAGQSAHVIVANPYGISCNGCGFINTPQATLTTGKPVLDNGRLDHYQVDGGSVAIDGAGLNASNVDRFEIITRATRINAEIQANNLAVIAGANDVEVGTLKATPRVANPADAPQVAIDSTALGGMYAGSIRLVGTEAGVGVRLAGKMVASGGDLQLDANGQLSVGEASSSGSLTAKATNIELQGQLYAGKELALKSTGDLNIQRDVAAGTGVVLESGGRLVNRGVVESGVNADGSRNTAGDVRLHAQALENTGRIIASKALTVETTETLNNRGGTLSGKQRVTLTAKTVDNRQQGQVLSAGALAIDSQALVNAQGGLIAADGDAALNLGSLDNRDGGRIISQGSLKLKGTELDNRKGTLGAGKALHIEANRLDNSGAGRLLSNGQLSVLVQETLNNQSNGQINALGRLDVNAGRLDNREGELSAGGSVKLEGGVLDNRAGRVSTLQNLNVSLAGVLDNGQGFISSEGIMVVNAQGLNNRLGSLASTSNLTLAIDEGVDNQGGTLVTDAGLMLASASLDNSQKGVLSAKGMAQVFTDQFNNSNGGQLSSGDQLSLNAGHVDNSQGGLIASQRALLANVRSVDNSAGSILGNQAVTLMVDQALTNIKGQIGAAALVVSASNLNNQGGVISSNGDMKLDIKGLLDNGDAGLINSAGALGLAAVQLNNQNEGTILAETALDLTATDIDNSNKGLINSRNALTIKSQTLNAGALGEVSAGGDMLLDLSSLSLNGGRLLGAAAVSLDLHGGNLDNRDGLINASGPLLFTGLAEVDNRNGEVSSNQGFDLSSQRLDNRGGSVLSNGLLGVSGPTLLNQGGLLSGRTGLTVSGVSLDNRDGGTLLSRLGGLNVDLSGALLNSNKGALASAQGLILRAASVDNSAGGLIASDATLTLQAETLDNQNGSVSAEQWASFSGTDLNNSQGTFSSQAAVTLDLLGKLTNTEGTVASGSDLLIKQTTQVDNQSGTIASQGLLKVFANSLDNRNGGTLAARDQLVLSTQGALNNSDDGLIYSQTADIQLSAASLDNARGALQSHTALTLSTGDLNNQAGRIVADEGDLDIAAHDVDNRGGVLASLKAAFQGRIVGVLRNDYTDSNIGGTLQALSMHMVVEGGISNQGGRIHALAGAAIIDTADFDNRDGGVSASGFANINARNLNNSRTDKGYITASGIALNVSGELDNRHGLIESTTDLAVEAASLDNRSGSLRALGSSGATTFNVSGVLDNRKGAIETANTDVGFTVGGFQNLGGSLLHVGRGNFGLATSDVVTAGGSLSTLGAMKISASRWVNDGVLKAGLLTLDVADFEQTANGELHAFDSFAGTGTTWVNNGLLVSEGVFSLKLAGAYSGAGRMESLGAMSLDATTFAIGNGGSVNSGGKAQIGLVSDMAQFANAGAVNVVGDLSIRAGSIVNSGTLATDQKLQLSAQSITNDQGGLLFSGSDMSLYARQFTNRLADVYSLGGIDIAADANGAWSASIENMSGSMESAVDFSIRGESIVNQMDKFEVTSELYSSAIGVRCYSCSAPTLVNTSGNRTPSHVVLLEEYRTVIAEGASSRSANMIAGRDLIVYGGGLENKNSLVTAMRDIKVDVRSFENSGTALGDYKNIKYLDYSPAKLKDLDPLIDFNRYNDEVYNNSIHFWNSAGQESLVNSYSYSVGGGKPSDATRFVSFGTFSYSVGMGGGVSQPRVRDLGSSLYSTGYRMGVPAAVRGARVFEEKIVSTGESTYLPAIIQAGGKVTIKATESITNGVEKSNALVSSGPGISVKPAAPSAITPTFVSLNSQLPPDLAQQQVNPVTLPGFSLPTGDNGLFQLTRAEAPNTVGANPTERAQQSVPTTVALAPHDLPAPMEVKENTELNAAATGGAALVTGVDSVVSIAHVKSQPNYLIETNPALTDLKSFMSSDYLLSKIGYDPDQSTKRLGDGFYEQKLIQQAVVARTGQRFIDGQTTDEGLYKYLMDNAIASKEALDLTVGVSLTAAQVTALTHDMVWLEEHEVNGEKVLVPVLYMAQANNRLAPNGALIAGNDVSLIAGKDLKNIGTLRASNDLSVSAGGAFTNTGLVDAADRLTLSAQSDLTNKAGGIIKGQDVKVTSVSGSILNERSKVTEAWANRGFSQSRDYLDNAARIEAGNDLTLDAGKNISNLGGVLQSGRDIVLGAKGSVAIGAVSQTSSAARDRSYLSQRTVQHGAQVTAGRDLLIDAQQDISATGSLLSAKRNIDLGADRDITLASAQNSADYLERSKKTTLETHSVTQQSTRVEAGGDVSLNAGANLGVIASSVKAVGTVDIDAAQDITIASAKDESAYYYFKKKKGSFGRGSTTQQESYSSTNIESVIEAGKDLTVNVSKLTTGGLNLDGGRNVSVIGSTLKAGDDLLVGAKNDVAVLSGVEEQGSYYKKTKTGFLGLSKSGKSQLTTTATQVASELSGGNDLVLLAGNDINLRASDASAGNNAELQAGLVKDTGDINLVAANDTAYSRAEQYNKKIGLSSSGGFISVASAKQAGQEAQSSTSVGSDVHADNDAKLAAKRDINLIGSRISAGQSVNLDAGRDVNIVSAENSQSKRDWNKEKKIGVGVSGDSNGVSLFVGGERAIEKNLLEQQTAAASSISAGEDINIVAKRDINQVGSDLNAFNDINLTAGHNITLDAAKETKLQEQQRALETFGLTVTASHNFGSTSDAVGNAGSGDNAVSQGSSTLKAVDAVSQFLQGPTADAKFGSSKQSSTQTLIEETRRSSTLSAGNDVTIKADNDITARGTAISAGRDISVTGRDITLDVAQGGLSQQTRDRDSWGGLHGSASAGVKLGVGGSFGNARENTSQQTSTATQLDAGRNIQLTARNDLSLIGTQAEAEGDIDLNAGNDLKIQSVQNASTRESERQSGGGEIGLSFGQQGVGAYASVNLGKGNLDREALAQQQAYLHAGKSLNFDSGKDTTIRGATLRGDEVVGRVGGDLTLASAADTGKVKGKESDLSVTLGSGLSGSLGYGKTTGQTNWVQEQTSIGAKDRLDIRTENHTQLDGAVIASDSGNLKLDTGTLGYSDIAGKDKEHGYYLNVGGSLGPAGGGAPQDQSQVGKGKEGENNWSVSGWDYQKDREQIVRATVGAGEVVVRDAPAGKDATAGLNRDVDKAYDITRDEESRTDVYVSSSSLEAVANPSATLEEWKANAEKYGANSQEALSKLADMFIAAVALSTTGNADVANVVVAIREINRQLSGPDDEAREALVHKLLGNMINGQETVESQALEARIVQLAKENPELARNAIAWLISMDKRDPATQGFVPALAVAGAAISALGAALIAGTTSNNPEAVSQAANSLMEAAGKSTNSVQAQLTLSAELWTLLVGTTFPIHVLDPKYGTLVTPVVSNDQGNGASGGFGGGSQPLTPVSTGGSGITESGGWSTTLPPPDTADTSLGAVFAESVKNMEKFFSGSEFGQQMYDASRKTVKIYDGQSVYQATEKIGKILRKGDQFYLDGQHMDHLEVFNSRGQFVKVLNLDGTLNKDKTNSGQGRTIK